MDEWAEAALNRCRVRQQVGADGAESVHALHGAGRLQSHHAVKAQPQDVKEVFLDNVMQAIKVADR